MQFWYNYIGIIKKVSDKMITINKNIQSEILMTTMEELVPKDSLFRKVDKYIDFTFIYEEVKDLYCNNNGRPSIDPVVLFKSQPRRQRINRLKLLPPANAAKT